MRAAERYRCGEVLADLGGDDQAWELRSLFCEIQRFAGINVDLAQAPLAGSFDVALSVLRDWAKAGALEFPTQTIFRRQAGEISVADLGPGAEERFFAVRALSFIVMDLEQDPPTKGISTAEYNERDRQMAAAWGINGARLKRRMF